MSTRGQCPIDSTAALYSDSPIAQERKGEADGANGATLRLRPLPNCNSSQTKLAIFLFYNVPARYCFCNLCLQNSKNSISVVKLARSSFLIHSGVHGW